ncbi:MAG: hypothetical protein JJE04_22525 [Acidobacteriia bacterium]|nr:hypothetical protein [Terriglobia bacterium]
MRLIASSLLWVSLACPATPDWISQADHNGRMAAEALARGRRVMHAWLKLADPVTGLLPRTETNPNWVVRDSAADLYPFMVLAAYFTEPHLYATSMHHILRQEMLLTTRVGRLSDDLQPGGRGFVRPELMMDEVIFGSSEYMKDGLLPITELLGETPWYHRMLDIATDMVALAPYKWKGGPLPAQTAEINGNALQVLSRLGWKTRDQRLLDQLITIADFYFLHQLPATNYLPAHEWDVKTDQPRRGVFVFSDHGNEIVGGLTESYVLAKTLRPGKAKQWEAPLRKLLDRVLEVGRNTDGVWVHSVDVATGKVVDQRHAHCWGYMFNAIYTGFLMTGDARYKQAVVHAMDAVVQNTNYLFDESGAGRKWGANAYSDSIEGALVLLNRIPHNRLERALDEAMKKYFLRQRDNGIVEYWYGDGNYIRTAMMYAFFKSQGAFLSPYDERVQLGAVREASEVSLLIKAAAPWQGVVRFDIPRHREHWNMAGNYPRLNEWPEWFTVESGQRYEVAVNDDPPKSYFGFELRKGLPLAVGGGEQARLRIRPSQPKSAPLIR